MRYNSLNKQLSEKKLKNLNKKAQRQNISIFSKLERRLDVLIFRLNWANSLQEAQDKIKKGKILLLSEDFCFTSTKFSNPLRTHYCYEQDQKSCELAERHKDNTQKREDVERQRSSNTLCAQQKTQKAEDCVDWKGQKVFSLKKIKEPNLVLELGSFIFDIDNCFNNEQNTDRGHTQSAPAVFVNSTGQLSSQNNSALTESNALNAEDFKDLESTLQYYKRFSHKRRAFYTLIDFKNVLRAFCQRQKGFTTLKSHETLQSSDTTLQNPGSLSEDTIRLNIRRGFRAQNVSQFINKSGFGLYLFKSVSLINKNPLYMLDLNAKLFQPSDLKAAFKTNSTPHPEAMHINKLNNSTQIVDITQTVDTQSAKGASGDLLHLSYSQNAHKNAIHDVIHEGAPTVNASRVSSQLCVSELYKETQSDLSLFFLKMSVLLKHPQLDCVFLPAYINIKNLRKSGYYLK